MKSYSLEWLFALTLRCALFAVVWAPLHVCAEVTPSEPKTADWIEPHPQFKIAHSDKYIEYKRDGKVVYRAVERTTQVSMPSHPDDVAEPVITHLIEFIADGKVFASIGLDKGEVRAWTLNSGTGVYFSSVTTPPKGDSRSFWVCVPKRDYFEYVDVSDSEVKPHPESDSSYTAQKRAYIKMTEEGSIKSPY